MSQTKFSAANARFNQFLFEPIGDDARGVTISMFSGLARLELDPWQESARIAALPVDLACRAIAERVGQLNISAWDAGAIAKRLVKLLPSPGGTVEPQQPAASPRSLLSLTPWLIFLAAASAMLMMSLTGSPAPSGQQPSYGNVPGLNAPHTR